MYNEQPVGCCVYFYFYSSFEYVKVNASKREVEGTVGYWILTWPQEEKTLLDL